MNPGCRVRDQLNTSEPTAPYIIGRQLNLRKLSGRQWESCPQPYEQLRPKTIKTSASTESATPAYISQHLHHKEPLVSYSESDTTRRLYHTEPLVGHVEMYTKVIRPAVCTTHSPRDHRHMKVDCEL